MRLSGSPGIIAAQVLSRLPECASAVCYRYSLLSTVVTLQAQLAVAAISAAAAAAIAAAAADAFYIQTMPLTRLLEHYE